MPKRPVTTILENAAGSGIAYKGELEGAAIGGNLAPVVTAKDVDGNYKLIETRLAGAAGAGVGSLPTLPAVRPDGTLAPLPLNEDGELVTANKPNGTGKHAAASLPPISLGAAITVVDLTLVPTKVYEDISMNVAGFFPGLFELVQVNDATITVLGYALVTPNCATVVVPFKNTTITAGATGTQVLRVRGTQYSGELSEVFAYVEAFEKA